MMFTPRSAELSQPSWAEGWAAPEILLGYSGVPGRALLPGTGPRPIANTEHLFKHDVAVTMWTTSRSAAP